MHLSTIISRLRQYARRRGLRFSVDRDTCGNVDWYIYDCEQEIASGSFDWWQQDLRTIKRTMDNFIRMRDEVETSET